MDTIAYLRHDALSPWTKTYTGRPNDGNPQQQSGRNYKCVRCNWRLFVTMSRVQTESATSKRFITVNLFLATVIKIYKCWRGLL